jgi:predicted nucleic acid-binding protein
MSGKEILVDTNIILYLLRGNDTLQDILQSKTIYISFITELELIGFKQITAEEERQIEALLDECVILPLTNETKRLYVSLRKKYQLKLADALIAATAISAGIPLITADKQFRTVVEISLLAFEL